MNKLRFVFAFVFGSLSATAQQSIGMLWADLGVKGQLTKDLEYGVSFTSRVSAAPNQTFFPQVTLKYKVTKWLKPSIDYRGIYALDKYGNFLFSNRLNFNTEFKYAKKRLDLRARIRYQYSFNTLSSSSGYDAEFDQAVRLKTQFQYDLNNSFLSPLLSFEIFYNPAIGPSGRQLSKYRGFAGVALEIDGPHDISVGYMIDHQMNTSNPLTKHILSVSYTYNIPSNN
ncbi:MAG: hypothetical protein RL632_1197 [Bacteroidota bacterium]